MRKKWPSKADEKLVNRRIREVSEVGKKAGPPLRTGNGGRARLRGSMTDPFDDLYPTLSMAAIYREIARTPEASHRSLTFIAEYFYEIGITHIRYFSDAIEIRRRHINAHASYLIEAPAWLRWVQSMDRPIPTRHPQLNWSDPSGIILR